ncbi:MAG: hypothetical protein ACTHKG_15230 [Nocardioides sp.]
MRAIGAVTVAVVLLLALGGCGGDVRRQQAESVSAAFHRSYEEQDATAACAVLAPPAKSAVEESVGKPCDAALLSEELPSVGKPDRVEVFGTEAQVRYDGETTFLARYRGGWKVVAAGCSYRPHEPYDCTISGG